MGWHPWAEVGPHGAAISNRLEKEIAGPARMAKTTMHPSIQGKLDLLINDLYRQTTAGRRGCLPYIPGLNNQPLLSGGNIFGKTELQDWDVPEEPFVGPIRFRGVGLPLSLKPANNRP